MTPETEGWMDIAEIRFLEGPNLFLLGPAVKVEVVAPESELAALAGRLSATFRGSPSSDLAGGWRALITEASRLAGQPPPETTIVQLDGPGHRALVFSWSHRPFAAALSELVRAVVLGDSGDLSNSVDHLKSAAAEPADPPTMVRDADRSALAIAVTGTNGKTTTTRLLAHIGRTAGRRVGWSSSSGVYIDGDLVEGGDYSGPSGANRVLTHGGLDLAVLETARGGILLKGLGYESNDVSVFTNVSGDHLGLHGVHRVETLAKVKSVVCRVTRAGGVAVLNADDSLVLASTEHIFAERCLVTRRPDNSFVVAHAEAGGRTVVRDGDAVVARTGAEETFRTHVSDIPMCFGGKAEHQVENAMGAIGAALAAGMPTEAICDGLRTFGSDLDHNPGRLNVFDMGRYTVVLDYAHNEAGLERLLAFGREIGKGEGRLVAVIGTAGDRDPELLRALGRLAAEQSDHVIAKGTERYLRGIAKDELFRHYREGARSHPGTPYEEVADEWAAVRHIPQMARDGDVYVLMFQEMLGEVQEILREATPS